MSTAYHARHRETVEHEPRFCVHSGVGVNAQFSGIVLIDKVNGDVFGSLIG
jgi:hypothetical protein